jgi:hypothetical protein
VVKLALCLPKAVLYKEKKQSNKVAGIKWPSKDEKIFIKEWKRKHTKMIDDGGL